MGQIENQFERGKEKIDRMAEDARGWIVPLARFGYAAKGVVYVIIGVIAAMAAYHGGSGDVTGSRGALETILRQPFGQILLGIVTIGLIGHAIWRFVQAIKDTENKGSDAKGIGRRILYAVVGVIYSGLAIFALSLIFGSQSGGGNEEAASQEWTAKLLAQPFGQYLVGAIGLGIAGAGVYQFYKAYTKKFREKLKLREMSASTEKWATRFGQAGLSAKGVVFVIIGIFLIQAAIESQASEARGLSGALRTLEQQPFGIWILAIVALGLIAYGLFMFVLARYRRIFL